MRCYGFRLVYATTQYKVQGQTCHSIAFKITPEMFPEHVPTLLYMLVSRVRQISDLYILDIDEHHLRHLIGLMTVNKQLVYKQQLFTEINNY